MGATVLRESRQNQHRHVVSGHVAHGLRHLRFHCTRCGNCCRQFRVPLTDVDLARLVLATGRPPSELVDWLSPTEVDMTGEPESFVVLPEGRRLMTLAWRDEACRFLAANECSVHADRPMSCRGYPFSVTLGRRGGVRRLRLLDIRDCEHTWAAQQNVRNVARQAATQEAELVRFTQRVVAFNRSQRLRRRVGKRLLDDGAFYETLELPTVGPGADAVAVALPGLSVASDFPSSEASGFRPANE